MTNVRRVLVVDDEAMLRSLVSRAFRERGYEVVEASDGVAALEATHALSRPFDLVITDSRMPGLDGPHLVERLREAYPEMQIIHLSGSQGSRGLSAGMPSDIPTFLKPFNLGELVAAAEQLMGEGPARGV
jgi:two-component system cell cycle sensor histidine kinase/response regulator CckA